MDPAGPGQPTGYDALADLLRTAIHAGQLRPGQKLPGETDLQQRYGLARDTVRRAIAELRREGLVEVRRGYGQFVFDRGKVEDVPLPAGAAIESRMPSPAERKAMRIPEGWPLLVVTVPGEDGPRLYPAHRYRIRAAAPE